MMATHETKKALIVVRTYPTPARKGVEVSCTAAITEEGQWLRLFPVPYRFLELDQRFRKYQWVQVSVTKASDARPESYRLAPDSLRILSEPLPTTAAWRARKDIVFPLRSDSLCALKREQEEHGFPTLGLFRPKSINRLTIKNESPEWTESQRYSLAQGNLFLKEPEQELEKVPHSFSYEFQCDEYECSGHKMICTDWEMGQAWRKWRDKYGDGWESKFRQRFETEMIQKYDTHFYVGTVHQHPKSWIIVGLFYPPRQQQTGLFG